MVVIEGALRVRTSMDAGGLAGLVRESVTVGIFASCSTDGHFRVFIGSCVACIGHDVLDFENDGACGWRLENSEWRMVIILS